jgi:hypothetical protein
MSRIFEFSNEQLISSYDPSLISITSEPKPHVEQINEDDILMFNDDNVKAEK